VPPERGAGARLEIRLGDATANPYLAPAATLAAMYLGVKHELTLPEPVQATGAVELPRSLDTALAALDADPALGEMLGADLVCAYVAIKQDELARFGRYVTDWEFREYAHHL